MLASNGEGDSRGAGGGAKPGVIVMSLLWPLVGRLKRANDGWRRCGMTRSVKIDRLGAGRRIAVLTVRGDATCDERLGFWLAC